MEKQVAVIVKDDLTELNKRLATGFRVYQNYMLGTGDTMFVLTKYETRNTNPTAGNLTVSETSASFTSESGVTYSTQTQG